MLKSMEDLFVVLLQDIYFSERQMYKTLTELAAASGDAALREAFAARRLGTAQVSRLLQFVGRREKRRCRSGVTCGRVSESRC